MRQVQLVISKSPPSACFIRKWCDPKSLSARSSGGKKEHTPPASKPISSCPKAFPFFVDVCVPCGPCGSTTHAPISGCKKTAVGFSKPIVGCVVFSIFAHRGCQLRHHGKRPLVQQLPGSASLDLPARGLGDGSLLDRHLFFRPRNRGRENAVGAGAGAGAGAGGTARGRQAAKQASKP